MKLIIAGGRTFHDYDLMCRQVRMLNIQITEVVSGRARGADQLGERFASEHGYNVAPFPADWTAGDQAGFARNEQMAQYADGAIVFWDESSAGSRHMIECMARLGKPCRVVRYASTPEPAVILRHDGSDEVWLGTLDEIDQTNEIIDPVPADILPLGTVIENVCTYRSTVRASMDFETYSEAGYVYRNGKVKGIGSGSKGGLGVVGTPAYAEHPSTEILCLYYDLKDGKGRRGWIPGLSSHPHDLINFVANGGIIEAWNVTFEYWIWNLVCTKKHGFPPLPIEQTVCVMARARRHSLPGALGKAAKVLGTAEKDKKGGDLIRKLTRPHTPTKKRPFHRWTPQTAWNDFVDMYQYCDQDVKTEDEAAARIPDLTQYEHATWQADQRINARGVQVDVETLDAMLDIQAQAEKHFTMELVQITGGAVGGASEVAKIIDWLGTRGIYLTGLTADDVKDALKNSVEPGSDAARVLEIRQALASANIKKLRAIKLQVNSDGRLRDQYMYCGADRTGRWSAGGVQMQNLTAKGPKSKQCNNCGRIYGLGRMDCPECMDTNATECKDWTIDAVEFAIEDIKRRDLKMLMETWGDPITALCGCLRGLFIAKEGHVLTCCDFSAIEAVAAACLTRCQWRIDVFNTHGKIYEMGAAKITGTPFEEIMAYQKETGQNHPLRKTVGKVSELASGYSGWINAWKAFGADAFMSDDEIKEAILAWREASPEIVEMWGGQHRQIGAKPWDSVPELYGLEGAAVAAILNPGQTFRVNDLVWGMKGDTLLCQLPSGRFLHYHRAKVTPGQDHFRRDSYKITFEGYNSNAQKGPPGWTVLETYGGRLFENVVQAVSADIQAEALVRLEQRGYPVVMHTHDEASAETPINFGSVEEMEAIMSERPAWASWWPLRSAGWRHKRYQKD